MNVRVGQLQEGQPFRTLLTNRRGIVLHVPQASRTTGGFEVELSPMYGNVPERKILHPAVRVSVPEPKRAHLDQIFNHWGTLLG